MALHYIAFVWTAQDSEQGLRVQQYAGHGVSQGWLSVLHASGLIVLVSGDLRAEEVRRLDEVDGVILGTLFGRRAVNGGFAAADLEPVDCDHIARSSGRALISDYWGDYVAFGRTPGDQSVYVVRGPASLLPCLYTIVGGVDVYFSRMEDCLELTRHSFSISWPHVARCLLGPLASPHTSIEGVNELLPGMRHVSSAGRRRSYTDWDPVSIASGEQIEDVTEAARLLRDAIRASVHAWASRFSVILHGLSGGLDSSLVLACLKDAPTAPRIVCVTHFSDGRESDERPFARAAARHLGCELIESRLRPTADLRRSFYSTRWEINPGLRMPEVDRIEPELAARIGAQAIFRGRGGDELFCRHHHALSIADFVRRRGVGPGLAELLTHVAVMEGDTAWRLLARGVSGALIPRRWNVAAIFNRDQENASLLRRDVVRAAIDDARFVLPYARTTWSAPPGRLWQISLVASRRPFYSPFARDGDPISVAPLLSQPIIEACLRIPTYLQMSGRRDRALARAAFEQDLPSAILERADKGDAEDLALEILARNRPLVRELLTDGLLVQRGLIDRSALLAALSDAPSKAMPGTAGVFDLVGAEIWARAWQTRQPNS